MPYTLASSRRSRPILFIAAAGLSASISMMATPSAMMGLMVGAVHLRATLELLRQIRHDGYDGALYFDTFPDASGLDPVAECEANIATVRRLLAVADRLDADNRLGDALARQDAVASQRIVNEALIGA